MQWVPLMVGHDIDYNTWRTFVAFIVVIRNIHYCLTLGIIDPMRWSELPLDLQELKEHEGILQQYYAERYLL